MVNVHPVWDLLVIGGGPAGAMLGYLAARAGLRTALVERHALPRDKVCGGCLSARAVATLQDAGLAGMLSRAAPQPLHVLHVRHGRRAISTPLPGGVAICRRVFDAQLLRSASRAGCEVRSSTMAYLLPMERGISFRRVVLRGADSSERTVSATVVAIASGLARHLLRGTNDLPQRVPLASRVGFGGTLKVPSHRLPGGQLHMMVHRHAYIGAVRIAPDVVNIAGAADPPFIKAIGGPARCANAVVSYSGPAGLAQIPADLWRRVHWHGTERLTHHCQRAASERLVAIGDAAGYVEPFTGEGMTWALESAALALPVIQQGIEQWDERVERRWCQVVRRAGPGSQRACRILQKLLRMPRAVDACLMTLRCFPSLAERLAYYISGTMPDRSQRGANRHAWSWT